MPHCKEERTDRRSLHRHIARVHEKRYTEKRPAEKAHQQLTTTGSLKDHIRAAHTSNNTIFRHFYLIKFTSSEERPFKCENCLRDYPTRSEFAVHLRKYHGTSINDMKKKNSYRVWGGDIVAIKHHELVRWRQTLLQESITT
jgi:hypothetical protein